MKYTIHGHKYASKHTYYSWDKEHKYPRFEIIENIEVNIEADSLNSAYKWMLTNLPEYAIGCCIHSEDKRSFRLNPVKDFYLFLPNFETKTIVEHELACLEK